MQHQYGILNTAELITANPDKWDDATLHKFLQALQRFTGGRTKDVNEIIPRSVAAALGQLKKDK